MSSFLARASLSVASSADKTIKIPGGKLTYGWKDDLAEEEDNPRYLPKGYSTIVLELKTMEAKVSGTGVGSALMKKFLSSADAKTAELIFLDPVPGYGSNFGRPDESPQVDALMRFYSRFGFKRNPKSNRMWLVRVGSIPTSKLPT